MSPTITRRQFLLAACAMLGGVGLAGARRLLAHASGSVNPPIYLPLVSKGYSSATPPGKVVHVRHAAAHHWLGEAQYWNTLDQAAVDAMVNQGLLALTGAETLQGAWRAILPDYQLGQKVAIKVNFNNSFTCSEADSQIDALPQPVNSVALGLELIGAARADICVYDAIRAIPQRFVNQCLPGISFYDGSYTGQCRLPAGFSRTAGARVAFYPPQGVSAPVEYVNDLLMSAPYLINLPIMKATHPYASVTLGAKNHFGTVDNPSGMHNLVDVVHGNALPNYNPLVDLLASPLIGGKTVLTIGDGLFAARVYNLAPANWTTFGGETPKSLFFSKDLVAIDCVMHDLLAAEMGSALYAAANNYLRLAGLAGLGVFERGDPWLAPYGSGYQQIKYQRIDLA